MIKLLSILRSVHIKHFVISEIMPFYAVRRGRTPGVYMTWDECQKQIDKYLNARYKKFPTEELAWEFVNSNDDPSRPAASPYKSNSKPHTSPGAGSASKFSASSASKFSASSASNFSASSASNFSASSASNFSASSASNFSASSASNFSATSAASSSPFKSNTQFQSMRKCVNGLKASVDQLRLYVTQVDQELEVLETGKKRTASQDDLSPKPSKVSRTESFESSGGNGVMNVYTDGCCHNNGQHGATAGIGVYWGPNHPWNASERLGGRPTNNRAEIHAACHAIRQAKSAGVTELVLHTDSQFLINSITVWINKWKRNGWKLVNGKDVQNKDDFVELDGIIDGIDVTWIHVRGHQGIPGNEAADQLANDGARKPAVS